VAAAMRGVWDELGGASGLAEQGGRRLGVAARGKSSRWPSTEGRGRTRGEGAAREEEGQREKKRERHGRLGEDGGDVGHVGG
jgi:hypothetical protein